MSQTQPGDGAAGREPRFSQEQYDMIRRCSEAHDMGEWNAWRDEQPDTPIMLDGAHLPRAHLEGAILDEAHLEWADLRFANLKGADLSEAHLNDAKFGRACLEGANLRWAYLEGANLYKAHLERATFEWAHLEGAKFGGAHLQGANLQWATVDGQTSMWPEGVDRETDFTGVGLDSICVDPGLKQTLKDNIRRIRWQAWYSAGPRWKRLLKHFVVRPFWWVSDYGRSTGRIIGAFFGLALAFAVVYSIWPMMVSGLDVPGRVWVPLRALYFSVVTMTTLGFGDMRAAPDSYGGHILLTFQVLSGYVLLGALVTRLAVLFAGAGPARPYARREGA